MFYCLDENNNKVEAYDKEGVLSLLEEAIESGSLAGIVSDSAFVDKLKCCVTGTTNYVAFVTQAKYNELSANSQLKSNTIYYITDDTTCEDLDEHLDSINNEISALNAALGTFMGNVNRDFRKKDETFQFISGFTSSDLLYNASQPSYTGIDISERLLTGKTWLDTAGIGGKVELSINNITTYISPVSFNTMWSYQETGTNGTTIIKYRGHVQPYTTDGNNESPTIYLLDFNIEISNQNKILVPNITCINMKTGAKEIVLSMLLKNLVIYYK